MWKDFSIRYIAGNKMTSIFLAATAFISSVLLSAICGIFYNLYLDRIHRDILRYGSTQQSLEVSSIAYGFVLAVVCASLAAMIHNAFEISMVSRIHQLGILQSVGATPKQIITCLLHEALTLSIIPIAAGVVAGAGLCYGFMQIAIDVSAPVRGYDVSFQYHPGVAALSMLVSTLTVLYSAWIPARRLSRLSVLEAVCYGAPQPVTNIKKMPLGIFKRMAQQFSIAPVTGPALFPIIKKGALLSKCFGVPGELAARSLYSRKKAMRTTTITLTLAFLGFTCFLSFEALSMVDTKHTYFDYFRDKWDFMITADSAADNGILLNEIRSIPDVETCVYYRKAYAAATVSDTFFSQELKALGITGLTEAVAVTQEGECTFQVPVYILDSVSFDAYRSEWNAGPEADVILVNQIWDRLNSPRTDRHYIPVFRTDAFTGLTVHNADNGESVTIEDISFSEHLPVIRESFQHFSLTLVISERFYERMQDVFPCEQANYNILLAPGSDTDAVSNTLKTFIDDNAYTLENRIQEEVSDQAMRKGLRIIVGTMAVLLAFIGIANVFSATLGQIHQRRKEFARYFSVGLLPKEMRNILLVETLIITFRPLLITLAVSAPLVFLTMNISDISCQEGLAAMPFVPVLLFAAGIFLSVGTAYYAGGRRIISDTVIEVLKDESMI